jgi:hypothetical protein
MALNQTPVSRNLHASIKFLGLELEDLLYLGMAGVAALLIGQFVPYFSSRSIVGVPMNWFMFLLVIVGGYGALAIFKNGKPPGYLGDYIAWHTKPHAYSAMGRDRQLTREFLIKDDEE